MIYLDANATLPLKPAVRAAIGEAMERHGNPSSVHGFGRAARRLVEDARDSLSQWLGAEPAGVIFTRMLRRSDGSAQRFTAPVSSSTVTQRVTDGLGIFSASAMPRTVCGVS